jgi:hypothetical protein
LEAYTQSNLIPALPPGLNVKVYNTATSSFDLVPVTIDGEGMLVVGNLVINDTINFTNRAVPTTSVGSEGDFTGMVIIDNEYIYRCVADWDGTADIWVRVAFNTTPW